MEAAHPHLILNHLPIVGMLFSLLLLMAGLIRRNQSIIQAALVAIVVVGVLTIPAFLTGEAAEEGIEKVSPADKPYIHPHEEAGELALWLTLAAGMSAAATLFLTRKKHIPYLLYVVLVLAFVALAALARTGNLGGEIRHSEIRSNSSVPPAEGEEEHSPGD